MALNIFGIWNLENGFDVVDALLVSGIAIVIVFFVLALLIFITWVIQKGLEKVEASTKILPKEENQILATDEDAVVAVLVATIDFYKETGKNPEVKSVTKLED